MPASGAVAGHLENVLLHHFVLEGLGRAAGDQLAAIDQPQAVAVFRLVHVVRGDEDGHALAGQLVDQVPELAAADRIDARGRLVEEEDRRLGAGWRSPSASRCFQPPERTAVGRRRCSARPAMSITHCFRSAFSAAGMR